MINLQSHGGLKKIPPNNLAGYLYLL